MRLISYLPFLLIMIVSSLAQAAPQYSWNISVGTGVGYYGRPYVGPYYPRPLYGRHYSPYYRGYYSPPPCLLHRSRSASIDLTVTTAGLVLLRTTTAVLPDCKHVQ
jgi:hypothetical protein